MTTICCNQLNAGSVVVEWDCGGRSYGGGGWPFEVSGGRFSSRARAFVFPPALQKLWATKLLAANLLNLIFDHRFHPNSVNHDPMQAPEALLGLRRAVSALRPCTRRIACPRRWHRTTADTPKNFSTTTRHRDSLDIKAAPEIDLEKDPSESPLYKRVRVVPASPSYFTGHATFTDDLLKVQTVLRKYQTFPTIAASQAPKVSWKRLEDYRREVGGIPVRGLMYAQLVAALRRLNQIHPSLMGDDARAAMEPFKRSVQTTSSAVKAVVIDEFGRATGVGRRKTSKAKAWLVEGEGNVLINGMSLTGMFQRQHDRESALWALKVTDRVGKYNVFGRVSGGGVTGQAEALTLAISKALLVHEPALKPALRRGTFSPAYSSADIGFVLGPVPACSGRRGFAPILAGVSVNL